MRLRSLSVRNFGAVESADVSFEDGLNVLHGPNDLGKSTLAAAIRAALLLQHGSSGARPFVPWGTTCKPTVTVVLEIEGRLWRVHKVFGSSSGGKSVLEWSNDGVSWSVQEEGRGVDGQLRSLLRWGLAAPGGRGGSHGFPKSFLATVLLGEQAVPYRLLSQSLEGDAEDTGKTRLIEALQAMATDPLYQQVLLQAQDRVDEAFTAKGKRSTRKGSPFERVTAEIKARRETSEQLTAQVAESDAVVSRLGDLSARRDRAMTERSEVARAVERLDAALDQAREREALQAEVDAAAAALQEIQRNQEEMARLQTALSEAKAAVPKAEAEVEACVAALAKAREQRSVALAERDALTRGDDPEVRAQAQAREEAARALDAEAERLQAESSRLDAWRSARAERDAAKAALSAATQEADAAAEAMERAQAAKQAAEATHRELQDAVLWGRAERLAARLDVLAARAEAAEATRAEAASVRAKAQALEAELPELPDARTCAAIEASWAALQTAEATLRGGFRVALDLSVDAAAEVDGRSSPVARDAHIDAEREVVLRLTDVGTVTVRPGDPGAHAALEAARAQWETHAASLRPLGIETVPALREAVRARDESARARASLLRDAEVLEAKASPPDPDELESVRRDLESARRAADGVDPNACRRILEAHGDELEAAAREAEAEAGRAAASATMTVSEAKDAQTQRKLAAQAAEAASKHEDSARLDGDDVEAAAARLQERLTGIETRRAELQAQASAEAEAVAARKEAAAQALALAERDVASATEAEARARAALDEARAAQTAAASALDVRRDQAQHHDPLAAAERVARAEDALAAAPQPSEDISEARVSALRESLHRAEEALEDAERAVRQQEGALQQVGGAVVRERAQMAREALEDAERQEAEVALDYDGWRLLLGTLRDVENETGAHLGRALDEELAGRLDALSSGRYAGAALGADLETEGVVTAQGIQSLDRFSEGVKEQVATLLRVSVAEHLGTALVLDDHLAQTDPSRAEWFSRLLRESAAGIQVVVLTCRPGDYIGDDADEIHVVDLGRVVKRL
ncbi:MAG: AAA family ATPase [Nannocystaceae bacterium]|nr:AAA family ATPase [bacterium]